MSIFVTRKPATGRMSILSKYRFHSFWLLYALGSLDLFIDKQELMSNVVLKANGLCWSDTMNVSVWLRFEGKIFGLHKSRQWDSKSWQLKRVVSSFLFVIVHWNHSHKICVFWLKSKHRSRVEGWRGKSVSSPRLFKRSMQFSRTTLTYMLHTKVYVTYHAGIAFADDGFGLWT